MSLFTPPAKFGLAASLNPNDYYYTLNHNSYSDDNSLVTSVPFICTCEAARAINKINLEFTKKYDAIIAECLKSKISNTNAFCDIFNLDIPTSGLFTVDDSILNADITGIFNNYAKYDSIRDAKIESLLSTKNQDFEKKKDFIGSMIKPYMTYYNKIYDSFNNKDKFIKFVVKGTEDALNSNFDHWCRSNESLGIIFKNINEAFVNLGYEPTKVVSPDTYKYNDFMDGTVRRGGHTLTWTCPI